MTDQQNIGSFEFRKLIPFRITRLHSKLNRQAHMLLENFDGLTVVQWRVILILKSGECDTLSELADLTGFDKGMLSRSIAALIENGRVEVVRDEADLRVKRLRLTEDGLALCARLEPMMLWRQRGLLDQLTEEEYEIFNSILDRLEAAAERSDYKP